MILAVAFNLIRLLLGDWDLPASDVDTRPEYDDRMACLVECWHVCLVPAQPF